MKDFERLVRKLKNIQKLGTEFAPPPLRATGEKMRSRSIENLKTQGRGGEGPPLAESTKRIYAKYGEPRGETLANNMRVSTRKERNGFTVEVDFASGSDPDPRAVAVLQNFGGMTEVDERTRSRFAGAGINLRPTTTHLFVPGRRFWDKAYEDVRVGYKNDIETWFQQEMERS